MRLSFLMVSGILAIATSCDYYDSRLKIINKDNSAICVETFLDTLPDYPSANQPEAYLSHIILPNDTSEQTIPGSSGEWIREVNRSKNKKLNVFIYQADSVRRYHNMDSLNQKRRFKRLSFTLDELNADNWTVVVE